jgi:transcriptional regulator with XRE-family HTH domain
VTLPPWRPGTWAADFGGIVRRRRRQLGLTVADLASRAGYTKGLVSLVENARLKSPTAAFIRAVAPVLQIDAGELLARHYLARLPRHVPRELWPNLGRLLLGKQADAPSGMVRCTGCRAFRPAHYCSGGLCLDCRVA